MVGGQAGFSDTATGNPLLDAASVAAEQVDLDGGTEFRDGSATFNHGDAFRVVQRLVFVHLGGNKVGQSCNGLIATRLVHAMARGMDM